MRARESLKNKNSFKDTMKIAFIYDAVYRVKGGWKEDLRGRRLAKKHEVNWYRLDGGLKTMV